MQIIGIAPAIGLIALGGLFSGVQGSGNIKEEVRNVGDFSGVQVGHGFKANITVGPSTSVKISADDNILPLIKTEVRNGDLVIETERFNGFRSSNPITISITTPKLERVGASGGAAVTADGTTGPRFSASVSGGGSAKVSALNSDQVNVGASGGSRVELAGKAKSIKAALSGGASLRANDVPTESVQVEGSGGSRAEVNASAAIDASLSGGSRVKVNGDPPKKNVQKSGGSEVIFASR